METILRISIRTISVLIILFTIAKIMGKKQISQMNLYDYIIGITMGSIAADISLDIEKNIVAGVTSLVIYGLFSILVTFLTLKSITLRKIINGIPTLLIDDGKIIYNNLRREGIDINDLEELARQKGYFNLEKINYAILEPSGKISFLAKNNIAKEKIDSYLQINIIIDGTIIEENLKIMKKDNLWVENVIKKNGYNGVWEILLLTLDKAGNITIFPKDKSYTNNLFI